MRFFSAKVSPVRVVALFCVLTALLIAGWIVFVALNRPDYEKLRRGMSIAEAEVILGKPGLVRGGRDNEIYWYYEVRDWTGEYNLNLQFNNGQLAAARAAGGHDVLPE